MNEAVGLPAPTIKGFDYLSADPVSWGTDGPAAVLFAPLGDWCPHCSIHLDQLTGYLADNDGPQGAQLLLVTQEEQPSAQYPQDEWLASEGWPYPTVLDPSGIPISKAFGLTSVPTWILVSSDGTVAEVVDGHHVTPTEVFSRIEDLE
jgi:thiol-disulfide isomerase/thioredoxin